MSNLLVGNLEPQISLEIAFGGISLDVLSDCRLAWVGCSCSVDGQPHLSSVGHFQKGQRVTFSKPYRARSYVSAAGGFERRTDNFLAFGSAPNREPLLRTLAMPNRPLEVRVLPTPGSALEFPNTFTVMRQLDRKGIRLEGRLALKAENRTSEPTCVGAIQGTDENRLILLGPDGPTIGGYVPLAVVCSADLDRVAQFCPGDVVVAEPIKIDQAKALWRDRLAALERKRLPG